MAPAQSHGSSWSRIPSIEFEIEPPPAPGSLEEANEFLILHRYQLSRTQKDCELAKKQKHPTLESMYGPETKILSSHEVKKLEDLWDKVAQFTERVTSYHKSQYGRPRPYQTDDSLQPCIEKIASAKSYPSSHASMAMSTGCLLAKLYPKRKKNIETQAKYLGTLRVIVGVHHPSDVQAGQDLGNSICERLSTDESFLKDLKRVTQRTLEP